MTAHFKKNSFNSCLSFINWHFYRSRYWVVTSKISCRFSKMDCFDMVIEFSGKGGGRRPPVHCRSSVPVSRPKREYKTCHFQTPLVLFFQDFDWIDDAFSVLSNFGGERLAELFDAKFSVIANLTYHNIGKFEDVDTRLFRMAVQRYAQCLFGIRHDDYDYSQINILLPR